MSRDQIVIDIEHGIVSVYASEPNCLDVILVDWDGEGVDFRSPNMVSIHRGRHTHTALVLDVPVEPINELAGSNTEQAIEAACECGVLRDQIGGPAC
jgi:hypothetical protein